MGATSDGNADECYELVLYEVRAKLSWTSGTKRSLVLIGDANPHEPNYPQNTMRLDWKTMKTTQKLAKEVNCYVWREQPRAQRVLKLKQFVSSLGGTDVLNVLLLKTMVPKANVPRKLMYFGHKFALHLNFESSMHATVLWTPKSQPSAFHSDVNQSKTKINE